MSWSCRVAYNFLSSFWLLLLNSECLHFLVWEYLLKASVVKHKQDQGSKQTYNWCQNSSKQLYRTVHTHLLCLSHQSTWDFKHCRRLSQRDYYIMHGLNTAGLNRELLFLLFPWLTWVSLSVSSLLGLFLHRGHGGRKVMFASPVHRKEM